MDVEKTIVIMALKAKDTGENETKNDNEVNNCKTILHGIGQHVFFVGDISFCVRQP